MSREIVLIGRSNVGKSTLFWQLTGTRVRVGKRPGITLHPFKAPLGKVYYVDMPGYGFMFKASRAEQEKTKDLIVHYFEEHASEILLAVQVIDASSFLDIADRWEGRGEVPLEIELWEFLDDLGLDFDTPAAPANTAAADMEFDLDLGGDGAGDSLSLGDDLADFSLELETESKPAAAAVEDDFMLSLDDEPVAPAAAGSDLELDMPADFDLSLADETPATPAEDSFAAQLDEVSAELNELSSGLADELPVAQPEAAPSAAGLDMDDDFDFLSGTDETATKLDLARAYIDMGDSEGARDILDEVIAEGSEGQQQEARELISKLS